MKTVLSSLVCTIFLACINANSQLETDGALTGITLEQELIKNPDCPTEDFNDLKNWLEDQEHLPKISDEKLFQFFFSRHYDLKKTKQAIESFYTIKTNSPELFTNRDIATDKSLQNEFINTAVFTIPNSISPHQDRILYLTFLSNDVSKFNFVTTVKLLLMAYDAALYVDGTAERDVIVIDVKNIGLKHLRKTNIGIWRKMFKITQETLPVRRKAVHILNAKSYVITFFKTVLKQFLDKRVFNLIHFYRSTQDDFNLFYKSVPKEYLPSEHGSSLKSIEFYNKKFEEQLWKLKDFFIEDEKLEINSKILP